MHMKWRSYCSPEIIALAEVPFTLEGTSQGSQESFKIQRQSSVR